jgi:hypothetical protein
MDQKDEEILVIEQFRKYFPGFPKGKLVKSESPDFILKINPKKSIGIELTRLDNGAETLPDKIEATLENKNDKLNIYQKKRFNSIWLIIYFEDLPESKRFNFRNKLNNWNFYFPFDQVFLFDLFENQIFELK